MLSVKKIAKYILNRIRLRKNHIIFFFSSDISLSAKFESYSKISKHTSFIGEIGLCSYIGEYSFISGKIGRFTSIGSNCSIITGVHLYTYPSVTTSPSFYSMRNICGHSFAQKQILHEEHRFADIKKQYPIIIGNDCWINSHVKFVSGIKIGDGAVVLAGAVVTKDVPPYAIVGGVPAKIIRYRYDKEDIEFLLRTKWWTHDIEWFKQNEALMTDFKLFKEIYQKNNSIN